MIKDYRSIIGTRILEFNSGQLLGLVSDIIIHPDTGMVEAFWVKPLTVFLKNAILTVNHILEFKKHIYVQDDRVFADPSDIIRINDILSENRFFIGNQVKNEAGHSYGRCVNITFDTNSYALRQLDVKKLFLGFLVLEQRLFSYKDIIRVTEEAILIQDEASAKEMVVSGAPEAAAG